ncbi:hypothetical protein N0B28_13470 [Pseudomonas sp. SD17-1]|uniref:hypothetical protein n=1 Tax=Pseudomonas sp. SD17-1 TaxID=2976883 RepID=UPI0023DA4C33|nr:hypothetical protein [Pseudomonas sp. SD17-1]WEJ19314.1 hypothetical protein N0B28_13470 [Pseudomonas sp. SD17-1]
MNKEEIYDSQISPLMQQVIQIARGNGIAMIASFAIGHEDGGPDGEDATRLTVTTHLPDADDKFDERFSKSAGVIRNGIPLPANAGPVMHMTTTNPDGSKTLTAII